MAGREDIKDSTGRLCGWVTDSSFGREYWGCTKGLIGRFSNGRWWWLDGKHSGLGPTCDIGYSAVLQAEGGRIG